MPPRVRRVAGTAASPSTRAICWGAFCQTVFDEVCSEDSDGRCKLEHYVESSSKPSRRHLGQRSRLQNSNMLVIVHHFNALDDVEFCEGIRVI